MEMQGGAPPLLKPSARGADKLSGSPAPHPGHMLRRSSTMSAAASDVFAKARTGPYTLPEPRHENMFANDQFTQRVLRRLVPGEVYARAVEPELTRFGARAAGEIYRLGRECELNPPYLRHTDAWGRRIDEIVTSHAWKQQKAVAAEEGLIAVAYAREQGEYSRLLQTMKLFLYAPASGLFSCPLAMTDGAAKTIEANDLQAALPEAFKSLTSRDPAAFWTSGQWMTEKQGGSDVANGTETLAVPADGSTYKLYGYKWFSSATDADMALTLARMVDADGNTVAGTKGLGMFYVKVRKPDGSLNGIQVMKLKEKLGTRQMPTAELLLDGCEATLVSAPGRGIPAIAGMLSVTRLHNVISSVGGMRKITFLARDYATRRRAFGKPLTDHVLHGQTLARMEVETRGCIALMLELARLMGRDDCGSTSDEERHILRVMTPVAKMYTGKMTVAIASEGVEAFGGQGYIEETGIPQALRDAQVLPIWEGTSNIMSLDVLRSASKSGGGVLKALQARVGRACAAAAVSSNDDIKAAGVAVGAVTTSLLKFIAGNPSLLEIGARDITFSLAHVFIATLLLEHAQDAQAVASDVRTLTHWVARDLAPAVTNHAKGLYRDTAVDYKDFILEGYEEAHLAKL